MSEENNKFDYEWDIKSSNGMNVTENKLYDALVSAGLKPEPQYPISQMKVDFAFPDEMLVIEVNGPHHDSEEQKLKDKKRWFVLNNLGWKRRTFNASAVYDNPEKYAKKIRKLLGKNADFEENNNSETYPPLIKDHFAKIDVFDGHVADEIRNNSETTSKRAMTPWKFILCMIIAYFLLDIFF
jgi:very-short-patch-repair endonuclease